MTWRQFINNALRKSHGIFGEGCEFYFINQQNATAYIKVFFKDADKFSSAVSTFISDEELVGLPLVAHIIQTTKVLGCLQVENSDLIWLKKAIREELEDAD
ncbi:LAQU0S02e08218g1_1 [Lachancea quebecensis]|uniref:LAQU0S02e08218g1_1 n=1 Tax=Lachancea quebecensis TaxID=1654605 RepID=A0A0P1KN42_9SACH|nr:LAQU0S02e08218g1_1 [Lachancea quebecensis]